MNKEQRELLFNYIESNVGPILVDFIDGNVIPNSVILPANIDRSELNGHYENVEYISPKWLTELNRLNGLPILVIDKIDSIQRSEQVKFIEILKYKKVSTFELPENTVVILTAKEINKNTINEEVYSLVAHIKG